jgi:hypothetical protein
LRDLNLNPRYFGGSTAFIFVSFGESCFLVSWCAGGRCGMAGSDENRGKSRRPSAEDYRWSQTSGTWWSGDAVCGLHHACGDEERGFLGSTSKPRSTVCQWFGLKTTGTICQWFYLKITGTVCQYFRLKTTVMIFSGLASKSMAVVFSDLASKSVATVFSYLISKSVATVSWLSFKEK